MHWKVHVRFGGEVTDLLRTEQVLGKSSLVPWMGTNTDLEVTLIGGGSLPNYVSDNQLYNSVITAHAILMIFFMVMPALIGGFLRRDECGVSKQLLDWVDTMRSGLSWMASSNEGMSEGRVNRRNCWYIQTNKSKRSLRWEMRRGVARANFCMKTGPAITNLVPGWWEEKLVSCVKDRAGYVDLVPNSWTGRLLSNILTAVIYCRYISTTFQPGHSGKYLSIGGYQGWFAGLRINVTDYFMCKAVRSVMKCLDGGKITDQANAFGNAKDNRWVNEFLLAMILLCWVHPGIHRTEGRSKDERQGPMAYSILKLGAQLPRWHDCDTKVWLNSALRRKLSTSAKKTEREEPSKDPLNNKDSKGQPRLKWPNSIELAGMNDEVFEAQRELAKKAKEHGSGAKEVQNMQKLLAESLTFRIVTVANLLKNKGSGTAGVDNETLTKETTAEQKIELVEWLKKILRSKKPYKASPVRRVLIPKASFPPGYLSFKERKSGGDRGGDGKMRPLGIPTIKDRALQSLLNLVLEPVVELVRRLTIS